MKPLLFILLFSAVCYAESSVKEMPWPKRVCEFPDGEEFSFVSDRYEVRHHIPDDPAIQSEGGSGGPIIELTLRDRQSGWHTTFTTQSVGERLLVPWHGRPQIEVWSSGGGGNWVRELYRYVDGEYRSVRIDDFEHVPHHHNQKALKATLPHGFHGRGYPEGDPALYFIEARLPTP
ncbi:hypothetical protein CfE428DRAFT_4439 [Chthoniobacter flavus Ellin428]|uniref:Uncharacterized protein n=2 Tax=Chthoniobacter flavus TaxID=191863 RepID=B4D6A0_9BACT|nr:hypothetical protein [Chthoniobacter flavus]EDY18009.1 hypothetical protein CfE428DRAFT_4439 [Chthoniobacter flavus Ellin428]TCO88251.1 hypothetical protein EV701_11847 [Chthoniobacter flavus]